MRKLESVSFWQADFGAYEPNAAFTGDADIDVAIVGAGFTGLTVARELRKDLPGTSVGVFEGMYVGYGASGRNGGFNMTLFGLEPEVTVLRWGKERTRAAHNYLTRAVGYVRDLVQSNGLASDYQHTGMLRVAYSARQLKRLNKTIHLLHELGGNGRYQYLDQNEIQCRVASPHFRGAIYESDTGILNPCKHVRQLKRLAEAQGAAIYELSPVQNIQRDGAKIVLHLPNGTVRCKKLVIAVNGWSGFIKGLPKIRSRQTPVWSSQIVTEPLSDAQWDAINWSGRELIEDNRQLLHYFRRTVCGRMTMGGGNVALPIGKEMGRMDMSQTWTDLEAHMKWLFPSLKDVRVAYRWGGPVSVNLDMTPEIGYIGDERVIYANGCIGHGVSLTQLNGRLITDALLDRKTDLTDFWVFNRTALPWPPAPLGTGAFQVIKFGLGVVDRYEERGLDKPV